METTSNIPERISDLIIRYLSEEISAQDLADLKQWIEISKENSNSFNHLVSVWMITGTKDKASTFDNKKSYLKVKEKIAINGKLKIRTSHSIFLKNLMKYAAVGLICFTSGSLITWLNRTNRTRLPLENTVISAPLGAKSIINLPDGTKVWLNAGSKVEYNYSYGKDSRTLLLIGEAYFDVAKDKTRPFLVKTSQITVKALGTRFNVKAYPEDEIITATLEEGKIEVETNEKRIRKPKIILQPNEKIDFYITENHFKKSTLHQNKEKKPYTDSGNIKNMELSKNVNTVLYTSWKDDRWIIKGISLGALRAIIERRFRIKLVFETENVQEYTFTGTIENETLEQLLNAIKLTAPIDYKINKDSVLISINNSLKEKYKRAFN